MQRKKKLILLLLCLSLYMIACGGKVNPELLGCWSLDEYTKYEFRDDGTGTFHTALSNYEFTYSCSSNRLKIQFLNENIEDSKYTYEMQDGKLQLKDEGDSNAEYTFAKEDEDDEKE